MTWAVPFALLLGCSPGAEGGDGADGATAKADGGAPGDPNVQVGSFVVSLVAPVTEGDGASDTPGYTSVLGKISDGPTPEQLVWEVQATDGDCQLLTPRVPFCNTPCGGSAVCVEDDVCQDYPSSQSVGTVKVTGLTASSGAGEIELTAVSNSYQLPAGITLPYPAFSEGDDIGFRASGGVYAAFSVQSKGISPLELSGTTVSLAAGQPLTLTWNAASSDASKIHVKLDISHHGGSKGMITCDAADTGSLTLSAQLVSALLDLGVAGFPSIVVSRRATGSTVIEPGRVDLVVSEDVERAVEVPGLDSCTVDADCPTGETCQSDLTCK